MLDDRPYMRPQTEWSQRGVTIYLMMGLVAAFVLQCVNDVYLRSNVEVWLALTPDWLRQGRVWQLLTFQFLHGGVMHLLGNLLGLWFFGRFVEGVLGWRRFLIAYFGCGVIGGLLQGTLMVLFPSHFAAFVVGASAGISGIFAIFVRLLPGTEIRWNFILPIQASVLLWVTAGIALFFTLVPSGRGGFVAHAAHLGGIIAGVAFVHFGWHQDFRPMPGAGLLDFFKRRRSERKVLKLRFPKAQPATSWEAEAAQHKAKGTDTEFMRKEVDPILEKISAHGIQSLTEREKKILDAARARMAKR